MNNIYILLIPPVGLIISFIYIYFSNKKRKTVVDNIIKDVKSRRLHRLKGELSDGSTVHIIANSKIEDVTVDMLQEYVNNMRDGVF